MHRSLPAALLVVLAAARPAAAQDPVYQSQSAFKWHLDTLSRQEWTDDAITFTDTERRFARLRPRLEMERGFLQLGVGGDFIYGNDKNTEPPTNPIIRDNYKSRDTRIDLAFARLQPASWLSAQAGRFAMPLRTTEMVWDRDLRPQGASATLQLPSGSSIQKLAVTGVFARGSHVFGPDFPVESDPFELKDRDTIWMASLSATLGAGGPESALELMGAFIRFEDLDRIPAVLRRQNTRVDGALLLEYDVVDLVARYRTDRGVPFQLVVDYCFNTAVDSGNRGIWLAAVLGSVRSARSVLEYTYAKVDKDATLAAYATDDFLWGTGWEGHRGDLGFRVGNNSSVHLVGQLQRFKDSPRPEEREDWLKRIRVEARLSY
jgi:hypothetical protein